MNAPKPNPSEPVAEAQVLRNNRRQLIAIVVIALMSLGGSYFLFFRASDGAVWSTTNQGEWVKPALTVADLTLHQAESQQPATAEKLWALWVVTDRACDATCSAAVFNMRQLHVLLNKDADRVRRVLIAPDAGAASLSEAFPKMARWQLAELSQLAAGIYIVDPLGNLVLRYALDSNPKPVLSDLKRLLKVSQIG